MSSLINNIETVITNAFEQYITAVSSKYSVEVEELQELWNTMNFQVKLNIKKPEKKKKLKSEDTEIEGSCPYVLKRGRVGEKCGNKPCKGGKVYCFKHKKFEGTEDVRETPLLSKLPTTSRILKLNKDINKYVHEESGLYVVSKEDSTVAGSYRDGKQTEFLTEEDVSLCEKFGFKYETSIVRKNAPVIVKSVVDTKIIDNAKKIALKILSDVPKSSDVRQKRTLEDALKQMKLDDEPTTNKVSDDESGFSDSDFSGLESNSDLEEDI